MTDQLWSCIHESSGPLITLWGGVFSTHLLSWTDTHCIQGDPSLPDITPEDEREFSLLLGRKRLAGFQGSPYTPNQTKLLLLELVCSCWSCPLPSGFLSPIWRPQSRGRSLPTHLHFDLFKSSDLET